MLRKLNNPRINNNDKIVKKLLSLERFNTGSLSQTNRIFPSFKKITMKPLFKYKGSGTS